MFALAFVFPGEAAFVPDVGAAAVALGAEGGGGGDGGALLEGEGVADGVEFGGGFHAEEAAEVEEMLLAGGLLGEVGLGPLLDELGGLHVGGVYRGGPIRGRTELGFGG